MLAFESLARRVRPTPGSVGRCCRVAAPVSFWTLTRGHDAVRAPLTCLRLTGAGLLLLAPGALGCPATPAPPSPRPAERCFRPPTCPTGAAPRSFHPASGSPGDTLASTWRAGSCSIQMTPGSTENVRSDASAGDNAPGWPATQGRQIDVWRKDAGAMTRPGARQIRPPCVGPRSVGSIRFRSGYDEA